MVPNFLDIPLLLGREEVVRIAPLSSLKIGRNPRQAEEPAGGISGGGPDDDRADEVRRIVGSAEAARLSLANSPQDLSDPVSPSSRDMKASHEIAVCYRLSSPCVFPDVFCDVLQVEIVAATVPKVVPKICEFLLDLVTETPPRQSRDWGSQTIHRLCSRSITILTEFYAREAIVPRQSHSAAPAVLCARQTSEVIRSSPQPVPHGVNGDQDHAFPLRNRVASTEKNESVSASFETT